MAVCLLRKRKHNATKLAEEYCWAITVAVGRSCCGRYGSSVLESLGFNWTPPIHTSIQLTYVHSFSPQAKCDLLRTLRVRTTT